MFQKAGKRQNKVAEEIGCGNDIVLSKKKLNNCNEKLNKNKISYSNQSWKKICSASRNHSWVGGWMDGGKSRFKDCLQQSISLLDGGSKSRFKDWLQQSKSLLDGWMEGLKAILRIAYINQKPRLRREKSQSVNHPTSNKIFPSFNYSTHKN